MDSSFLKMFVIVLVVDMHTTTLRTVFKERWVTG
jgi:hypothetical protein